MSSRLVIQDAARQLNLKINQCSLWIYNYQNNDTISWTTEIWRLFYNFKIFCYLDSFSWSRIICFGNQKIMKSKKKAQIQNKKNKSEYGKFVWTRLIIMIVIYTIALIVAYCLPVYTSNPYLIRGLPLWMIFSASFMFAGIQQLPLQIFWQMKQLSYSLITARLSRIIIILVPVVYIFFKKINLAT